MKKILVVKYTPRENRSKTKQLLDYAISKIDDNFEIETIDLIKEVPEFFDPENLTAYYMRNYVHEELSDEQKKSLEKFDEFTQKVLDADKIVVAYPMFNFSMPASVKAFFDMVLQKGKTWDITEEGYVGLANDKELVLITTSGSVYNTDDTIGMDHSKSLFNLYGNFIGAKITVISAEGINSQPEQADEILNSSKKEIEVMIKSWN